MSLAKLIKPLAKIFQLRSISLIVGQPLEETRSIIQGRGKTVLNPELSLRDGIVSFYLH